MGKIVLWEIRRIGHFAGGFWQFKKNSIFVNSWQRTTAPVMRKQDIQCTRCTDSK